MNKKLIVSLIITLLLTGCVTKKIKEEDIIKRSIYISAGACYKINLDEEYMVSSIEGLDSKANSIVSTLTEDKNINETLKQILEKDIKSYSVNENEIINVLYYDENITNNEDYPNMIRGLSPNYQIDVFTIESITEEDKNKAKDNNSCMLDEAYIREQLNKNPTFTEDEIKDKSPSEIKDIIERGVYCEDKTYTLEGDFCLKKISEKEAKDGKICEDGYYQYKGKCYKEGPIIDTNIFECNKDEILRDKDCIFKEEYPADKIYGCKDGSEAVRKDTVYPGTKKNPEKYYCVSKENAQKPKSRCWTKSNHITINGECYVGPAPLLGGGCPSPDVKRGNGCYSPDQKKEYVCPDGTWYDTKNGPIPELCPDTFTYKEPEVLGNTCNDSSMKLEGDKCVRERVSGAREIRKCENGYTLTNNKCLLLNDSKSLSNGKVCDYDNSKLVNGKCYIYDIVEAKRK